jgi:hypothetical protein
MPHTCLTHPSGPSNNKRHRPENAAKGSPDQRRLRKSNAQEPAPRATDVRLSARLETVVYLRCLLGAFRNLVVVYLRPQHREDEQ